MEINPMWFVVLGVVVALIVAYRQGKLAGFVAKVKADEAKLATDVKADLPTWRARLEAFTKKEGKLAEADLSKFGDEIDGWFKKEASATTASVGTSAGSPVIAAPVGTSTAGVSAGNSPVTLEQRVASIKAELDKLL